MRGAAGRTLSEQARKPQQPVFDPDSFRFLSLDYTSDVLWRARWPDSAGNITPGSSVAYGHAGGSSSGGSDAGVSEIGTSEMSFESSNVLQDVQLVYDLSALQRCLGYPPELVDNSLRWWEDRIHSDDRPRVILSLKRALESRTARYWSESYRFRVYKPGMHISSASSVGSSGSAASGSSRSANTTATLVHAFSPPGTQYPSPSMTGTNLPPQSPVRPPSTLGSLPQGTGAQQQPSLHRQDTSSSSTSSSATTITGGGGVSETYSPTPSSIPPSRLAYRQQQQQRQQTHNHIYNYGMAAGGYGTVPNFRQTSEEDLPENYMTILDQMYIVTRSPLTNRPLEAIGCRFSPEQRIKISEALNAPRTQLLRSLPKHGIKFIGAETINTILENTTSGLFMMDSRGHPTYMNQAAMDITGYSSLDEISHAPLHYAVHYRRPDGSDYPMEECPIDNSSAELVKMQNQSEVFVKKDGTLFPVVW